MWAALVVSIRFLCLFHYWLCLRAEHGENGTRYALTKQFLFFKVLLIYHDVSYMEARTHKSVAKNISQASLQDLFQGTRTCKLQSWASCAIKMTVYPAYERYQFIRSRNDFSAALLQNYTTVYVCWIYHTGINFVFIFHLQAEQL